MMDFPVLERYGCFVDAGFLGSLCFSNEKQICLFYDENEVMQTWSLFSSKMTKISPYLVPILKKVLNLSNY